MIKVCKPLLSFFLCSFLLANCTAQAATKEGNYATYGHGGNSCGAYLEVLNKGRSGHGYSEENEYIDWARGYLSGYNRYMSNTYSILGQTDLEGSMAFIEKYCRENPLSQFGEAVEKLIIRLYPNRRTRMRE
jgi:hypothetical protein